jgi:hypothetical protein
MGLLSKNGYSAQVDIQLHVGDKQLVVAQVGPGSLVLRQPCFIPASTVGQLVIKVDEREERHDVLLFEGATSDQEVVNFF